jgi:CheY-like chemotaxis protein
MHKLELRVLVIDDCAAMGRAIERLLHNHLVTSVTDVRTALSLLVVQRVQFDAILCDMHMPGMNGEDFFGVLQAVLPREAKRVVFMTGDPAANDFLASIANECLEKPFTSDALRAVIARRADSTNGPTPASLGGGVPR